MEAETKPRIKNGKLCRRPGSRKKDYDLKLFTWNVRTLYQSRALQTLADAVEPYKASILAVQEVRWKGTGTIHNPKHDFYYSCNPKHHIFGTGFLVFNKTRQNVIDFQPIDERLCTIRIRSKFYNISIINGHFPTEEKSDEEKEAFYDTLDRIYESCPKHDMKIIIGDMNAKVGREEIYRKHTGIHSLHNTSNDNGIRLINFSATKDMVIGSTMFERRNIHKITWVSPDGKTMNQIDHVLVNSRYKSSLLQVRSLRGANVDSDHFLLATRIRARITNTKKNMTNIPHRTNLEALDYPDIEKNFQKHLDESLYQVSCSQDVDDVWRSVCENIKVAATKVLGKSENKRKTSWFDEECKMATEKKNDARKAMINRKTRQSTEMYENLRREEKKLHRKKKRIFNKEKFEQLETDFNCHNSRRFFKGVNEQRREFNPRTYYCKNEDGSLLTEKSQILERWATYFDKLLNKNITGMEPQHPQLKSSEMVEELTFQEFMAAIKAQKNNKSCGFDEIPAELFKHMSNENLLTIYQLVCRVWNEERMPKMWEIGIICPLHKKGDMLVCENYRPITLLNSIYKIFSNILSARLKPHAKRIIGSYQAGFQEERSTIDQIFVLRQILEKSRECDMTTYHLFIDFKAAYDSIIRNQLFSAMAEFGIPDKLIRLTRSTMQNVRNVIKVQNNLSREFATLNGLRQGDGLSCLLFNIALEKVIRDSAVNTKGTILFKSVQLLAYADDIDIIASSLPSLKEAFASIERAAKCMGLEINEAKTKALVSTTSDSVRHKVGQILKIGDYGFEVVKEFKYLGVIINHDNKISAEIGHRILMANRCYFSLCQHLKSRLLDRKTKISLYRSIIISVLLYGSETWTLRDADKQKLLIFERRVLRKIFGAICDKGEWRKRYNHELEKLYAHPSVITTIMINRLRWAGHILRANMDYPPQQILFGKCHRPRRRGRPPLRWMDGVEEDAGLLGFRAWRTQARNRDNWRHMLQQAKTRPGLSSQQ